MREWWRSARWSSGPARTSRAAARNGGAYRNRNAGIFTVRDGKIVSVREYTDTQHVAQVLL
jgi:ketosteroid isomerase-like protein